MSLLLDLEKLGDAERRSSYRPKPKTLSGFCTNEKPPSVMSSYLTLGLGVGFPTWGAWVVPGPGLQRHQE